MLRRRQPVRQVRIKRHILCITALRHLVRRAPVDIRLRRVQPVQTQNAISVCLVGIISRTSVITALIGVPVRQVRIKRHILCITALRHLVQHAVGAQSTVRRVHRRAVRSPVGIIQPDVTPVVIIVPVNHSVLVQHIAVGVCKPIALTKHLGGYVVLALGGHHIPSVIKHVRQYRPVRIAVPVH